MTAARTLDVECLAHRLMTAALNLEEDADIATRSPGDLARFHALLVSMQEMHGALTDAFRELAVQ